MKRIGTSNDIILSTCQGKGVKSELKTVPTNAHTVVVLANTNAFTLATAPLLTINIILYLKSHLYGESISQTGGLYMLI